jgi:hypothetical protein
MRHADARRALIALAALLLPAIATSAGDDLPTFERDVRPILARSCVPCHNTRNLKRSELSGGLALDSYEAVLRGAPGQKVVQPGKASDSALVGRLSDPDEDRRMPLSDDPLPPEQQLLIARWIDAGAARGQVVQSVAHRARRVTRSIDVVLRSDLRLPGGVVDGVSGGPVELVAKVGPLPAITALAFRGDGRLLAVCTGGEVVVWDLNDVLPVSRITDFPGTAHCVQFSRDGRRLVVGGGLPARSGTIRIHEASDGTLLQALEGHDDAVYGLALRRDGAQLASAAFDQTVRLWNLADGQPAGTFTGHSDFVYEVAYAADGRTLFTASKDRTIKQIDGKTAKGLRTYSSHDQDVLALAIRPDGSGFVSSGLEPALRWWSLAKDQPPRLVGGHGAAVHQLAFSADGKRLISASGDKTVRLWDGATGAPKRTLAGPTDWQYAVALSADGQLAAAGGWDGIVRVWDAEAGTLRGTLIQPPVASATAGDWLAMAPAGYAAASDGLRPLLHWRVGAAELPAEKLAGGLMDPRRLARCLSGQSVPAAFGGK